LASLRFDLLLVEQLDLIIVLQTADDSWRMTGIGAGNKGIPFGHVRKDFGPCVKAVAESEPNVNLFAVGEYLSWSDYLRIFCETQGLKYGGYDELSYDTLCELLPGGLGHEFGQNVLFAFDFGYEGTDPAVVKPDKVGRHPLLPATKQC
jgi:hypothetical protein